jgi:hypothetical protein
MPTIARAQCPRQICGAAGTRELGSQIDACRFRVQVGDLVSLPLKPAPPAAFGRLSGGYRSPRTP